MPELDLAAEAILRQIDFDETLLELLSQLEGRRVQSAEYPGRYDRLAAVKQSLLERVVGPGRHLALLVDEAQQLDDATLEGIRSLTNISAERQNFMTPILFGHTSLADRVEKCPPLASRVRMNHRLRPLSESATADYVSHRIAVATGAGEGPFTAAALRLVAVHDQRQRVHPVAVDQHVHPHERPRGEAHEVVVERRVTPADGF